MKRIIPLIMVTTTMLCGCQKQGETTTHSYTEPFYNEVEDLHIEWKNLFNQQNDKYYAYVYSVMCTPCSMLREEVTTFARSGKTHFYFITATEDVPFVEDPDLADASLGATSLESVYCYNTPTLIEITANAVTKYSRNYYEIKAFIESFD